MRSPTPAGAPLMLAGPRLPTLGTMSPAMSTATLLNGNCPPLVSPTEAGMMYPYDAYSLAVATGAAPLIEYPAAMDHSAAGMSYV